MSILNKIDREINERTRGRQSPEKVYLDAPEFEEFVKALEPLYRERYGALISNSKVSMEGETNILYRGVAVCLRMKGNSNN